MQDFFDTNVIYKKLEEYASLGPTGHDLEKSEQKLRLASDITGAFKGLIERRGGKYRSHELESLTHLFAQAVKTFDVKSVELNIVERRIKQVVCGLSPQEKSMFVSPNLKRTLRSHHDKLQVIQMADKGFHIL